MNLLENTLKLIVNSGKD